MIEIVLIVGHKCFTWITSNRPVLLFCENKTNKNVKKASDALQIVSGILSV